LPPDATPGPATATGRWLVFTDGDSIADRLRGGGATVVEVRPGDEYCRDGSAFRVRVERELVEDELGIESVDRAGGYWTTRGDGADASYARTSGVYLRADPGDKAVRSRRRSCLAGIVSRVGAPASAQFALRPRKDGISITFSSAGLRAGAARP